MRFPVASAPQVWAEVARRVKAQPAARALFWVAVVLLAVGALSTLVVPVLLGSLVDVVTGVQADVVKQLWLRGAGVVLAAVVGAASNAAGFYCIARVAERAIAALRVDMVGTALRLPAHRVEEAGSGDLVSRSTDDVAELSASVNQAFPDMTSAIFLLAGTAVMLVSLDWCYLAVVVVGAVAYWFVFRAYLRKAPPRYAAERASLAERARRMLEGIQGRDTVHAFSMEDQVTNHVNEASLDVVRHGYSARRTMMTAQVRNTIIEAAMLTAGLLISFYAVRASAMSIGTVTGAMLILFRLRRPIMGVMHTLDTVNSGYASLARIVGVIANPPATIPDAGAPQPRGLIELRDTWFRYESTADWAVRGLNLTVQPGCKVAIVGASGAGKSTVAALVAGLREPTAGQVLIDAIPVASLSDAERASRLALVSQEVHVFSGTLRDDLLIAAPEATDADLEHALNEVGAAWYHNLIDGLDTVVGVHGHQLDPVAAQQLALARVLLVDPAVVIMDEATAEGGSVGADALDRAARRVAAGRSSIVIAHRLDQAVDADEIVVMGNGAIKERGTHEELVSAQGSYAALWEAWAHGRDYFTGNAERK